MGSSLGSGLGSSVGTSVGSSVGVDVGVEVGELVGSDDGTAATNDKKAAVDLRYTTNVAKAEFSPGDDIDRL